MAFVMRSASSHVLQRTKAWTLHIPSWAFTLTHPLAAHDLADFLHLRREPGRRIG